MITIASIGLGSRGRVYLRGFSRHRDVAFTALCDSNPAMLEAAGNRFPQARRFGSDEEFFAAGKLADWLVIATWDPCHYRHADAALELGYNLILEKPVTAVPAELDALCGKAKEKNLIVLVSHVLRYSPYFSAVKEIIDSGLIGDIVNINHEENVGFWHYAHSFVRGNWRNTEVGAPFLLAKNCHDFDLLHWLINRPCQEVRAYGGQAYFRPENAPPGATSHCLQGCPHVKTCPYSVERLYLRRTSFLLWARGIATSRPKSPPQKELRRILADGQYGRCVYRCDNNVCDHHSAAMRFEGGATASFSVSAFSYFFTRRIRIQGTKGELWGRDHTMRIHVHEFGKLPRIRKVHRRNLLSGHGGADGSYCEAAYKIMAGGPVDAENMTTIEQTRISHRIVYEAMGMLE